MDFDLSLHRIIKFTYHNCFRVFICKMYDLRLDMDLSVI